ncbi:hypothetical protein SNEBB_009039 [Seison nebaliae]|nr:hypothetical protein SNEBB_009039 [Seison nebaliae]
MAFEKEDYKLINDGLILEVRLPETNPDLQIIKDRLISLTGSDLIQLNNSAYIKNLAKQLDNNFQLSFKSKIDNLILEEQKRYKRYRLNRSYSDEMEQAVSRKDSGFHSIESTVQPNKKDVDKRKDLLILIKKQLEQIEKGKVKKKPHPPVEPLTNQFCNFELEAKKKEQIRDFLWKMDEEAIQQKIERIDNLFKPQTADLKYRKQLEQTRTTKELFKLADEIVEYKKPSKVIKGSITQTLDGREQKKTANFKKLVQSRDSKTEDIRESFDAIEPESHDDAVPVRETESENLEEKELKNKNAMENAMDKDVSDLSITPVESTIEVDKVEVEEEGEKEGEKEEEVKEEEIKEEVKEGEKEGGEAEKEEENEAT